MRLPAPSDFGHDDDCMGSCCRPDLWPAPTSDDDLPEGADL